MNATLASVSAGISSPQWHARAYLPPGYAILAMPPHKLMLSVPLAKAHAETWKHDPDQLTSLRELATTLMGQGKCLLFEESAEHLIMGLSDTDGQRRLITAKYISVDGLFDRFKHKKIHHTYQILEITVKDPVSCCSFIGATALVSNKSGPHTRGFLKPCSCR